MLTGTSLLTLVGNINYVNNNCNDMNTISQIVKEYTNLTKIPVDTYLDVIAQFYMFGDTNNASLVAGSTIS